MVYDFFDKYVFLCEMYVEEADKIQKLILNFFPFDNSVQVVNPDEGKFLLRRVQLPSLNIGKLQIGNVINIFYKLLLITDCAPLTRRLLFKGVESTFALIKPSSPNMHGKIITYITKKGFQIVRMKNGKITKDFAVLLYKNLSGNEKLPLIVNYITSGEVIGLELVAPYAVSKWRDCLGADDPKSATPGTLRYLYGEDQLKNSAHGCSNVQDVAQILEQFFGSDGNIPRVAFQATYKDCTCCIIKPHAIIDGHLGAIIEMIATSGKFYISAMAMFRVSHINALEFYEIYKGVLTEYEDMAIQLSEGRCVALEVKAEDPSINCVCEFRRLCGPRDPDVCRQLYPETIRAKYGKTIVHNAVHCTDLPEDGETEVEYFFKLISASG